MDEYNPMESHNEESGRVLTLVSSDDPRDPLTALSAMLAPNRQCTARSKQSGVQCKRAPIVGGTVCAMHGGKAPQVQEAALRNLRLVRDTALERLYDSLETIGDQMDPRALLDMVVKLTDKVELLEGRATARSESSSHVEVEERRLEIKASVEAKLDAIRERRERGEGMLAHGDQDENR